MFCEQITFIDETGNDPIHRNHILGGILINNKYIICGECGEVILAKDVRIVRKFFNWVNLSDAIMTE